MGFKCNWLPVYIDFHKITLSLSTHANLGKSKRPIAIFQNLIHSFFYENLFSLYKNVRLKNELRVSSCVINAHYQDELGPGVRSLNNFNALLLTAVYTYWRKMKVPMVEEKWRTIFLIRQKTIVTVCFLAYSICQFCLFPPFLRNVIIYEKYLKIFPLIPKLLHSFLAGQGSGRLTKRIYASGWFVQMVIKNVHPIHKIMFKNILRTFEDEIFKYLKTFSFSQKNRMCL